MVTTVYHCTVSNPPESVQHITKTFKSGNSSWTGNAALEGGKSIYIKLSWNLKQEAKLGTGPYVRIILKLDWISSGWCPRQAYLQGTWFGLHLQELETYEITTQIKFLAAIRTLVFFLQPMAMLTAANYTENIQLATDPFMQVVV